MVADVVQPPAEASIGIDIRSVALALRGEAGEHFDMLEQFAFSGMPADPVESIQFHDALLCAAPRGQQQK